MKPDRAQRSPHPRTAAPLRLAAGVMWVFVATLQQGCTLNGGSRNFDAPELPEHDRSQHGYMHASGYSRPFLCKDSNGNEEKCPDDIWPEPQQLSCDASGCHGSYEFTPEQDWSQRDLLGSDGPSCYSCHGDRWSDRTE